MPATQAGNTYPLVSDVSGWDNQLSLHEGDLVKYANYPGNVTTFIGRIMSADGKFKLQNYSNEEFFENEAIWAAYLGIQEQAPLNLDLDLKNTDQSTTSAFNGLIIVPYEASSNDFDFSNPVLLGYFNKSLGLISLTASTLNISGYSGIIAGNIKIADSKLSLGNKNTSPAATAEPHYPKQADMDNVFYKYSELSTFDKLLEGRLLDVIKRGSLDGSISLENTAVTLGSQAVIRSKDLSLAGGSVTFSGSSLLDSVLYADTFRISQGSDNNPVVLSGSQGSIFTSDGTISGKITADGLKLQLGSYSGGTFGTEGGQLNFNDGIELNNAAQLYVLPGLAAGMSGLSFQDADSGITVQGVLNLQEDTSYKKQGQINVASGGVVRLQSGNITADAADAKTPLFNFEDGARLEIAEQAAVTLSDLAQLSASKHDINMGSGSTLNIQATDNLNLSAQLLSHLKGDTSATLSASDADVILDVSAAADENNPIRSDITVSGKDLHLQNGGSDIYFAGGSYQFSGALHADNQQQANLHLQGTELQVQSLNEGTVWQNVSLSSGSRLQFSTGSIEQLAADSSSIILNSSADISSINLSNSSTLSVNGTGHETEQLTITSAQEAVTLQDNSAMTVSQSLDTNGAAAGTALFQVGNNATLSLGQALCSSQLSFADFGGVTVKEELGLNHFHLAGTGSVLSLDLSGFSDSEIQLDHAHEQSLNQQLLTADSVGKISITGYTPLDLENTLKKGYLTVEDLPQLADHAVSYEAVEQAYLLSTVWKVQTPDYDKDNKQLSIGSMVFNVADEQGSPQLYGNFRLNAADNNKAASGAFVSDDEGNILGVTLHEKSSLTLANGGSIGKIDAAYGVTDAVFTVTGSADTPLTKIESIDLPQGKAELNAPAAVNGNIKARELTLGAAVTQSGPAGQEGQQNLRLEAEMLHINSAAVFTGDGTQAVLGSTAGGSSSEAAGGKANFASLELAAAQQDAGNGNSLSLTAGAEISTDEFVLPAGSILQIGDAQSAGTFTAAKSSLQGTVLSQGNAESPAVFSTGELTERPAGNALRTMSAAASRRSVITGQLMAGAYSIQSVQQSTAQATELYETLRSRPSLQGSTAFIALHSPAALAASGQLAAAGLSADKLQQAAGNSAVYLGEGGVLYFANGALDLTGSVPALLLQTGAQRNKPEVSSSGGRIYVDGSFTADTRLNLLELEDGSSPDLTGTLTVCTENEKLKATLNPGDDLSAVILQPESSGEGGQGGGGGSGGGESGGASSGGSSLFPELSGPTGEAVSDIWQNSSLHGTGVDFVRRAIGKNGGTGLIENSVRLSAFSGLSQAALQHSAALSQTLLQHVHAGDTAAAPGQTALSATASPGTTLWAQGYSSFGRSSDLTADGLHYSAKAESYGMLLGLEHDFGDKFSAGAFIGTGKGNSSGRGEAAPSKADFDSLSFGLYGTYKPAPDWQLSALMHASRLDATAKASGFEHLEGSSDVYTAGAELRLSYQADLGQGLMLTPQIGLSFLHLTQDDMNVRSSEGTVAELAHDDFNVLSIPAGFNLSARLEHAGYTFTPAVYAGGVFSLGEQNLDSTARFTGSPDRVEVSSKLQDHAAMQAGLSLKIEGESLSFDAGVTAQQSAHFRSLGVNATFSWTF